MVALLAIFVCFCSLTQLECSREIIDIENQIYALKEKASALEEENAELNQKLDKRKNECMLDLDKLKKESHLEQQIDLERLFIAELSNNITQKKLEEQIVLRALDREYLNNNKYYLKLEIYNHELDQFQLRRKNGVNERCQRYRPLMKKYKSDLSTRSLTVGSRNKTSEKARLLLLKAEYNEQIRLVKMLNDSNSLLKLQFDNTAKMCVTKKSNIQEAFKATNDKVIQVTGEKNLFEEEFSDVTKHLKSLYEELKELKENNRLVKQEVLDVIKALDEYNEDDTCYKEMFSGNIFYE